MSFSANFRHRFSDQLLAPVREQIIELCADSSIILDIGCGTGDLLVRASHKVNKGVGIDSNHRMIHFANQRKARKDIKNIEYLCGNIFDIDIPALGYDICTCTLFLHSLKRDEAIALLCKLKNCVQRLIICDYKQPNTVSGKLGVEIDELISGHYRRFKEYQRLGFFYSLISESGLQLLEEQHTAVDGLSIYVLEKL